MYGGNLWLPGRFAGTRPRLSAYRSTCVQGLARSGHACAMSLHILVVMECVLRVRHPHQASTVVCVVHIKQVLLCVVRIKQVRPGKF